MRVTNAMMTNTTLVNISRNMRYLDKLIQQIESTKKIQVPSDDPIVASRALKFRTSIAETEQYQRNVQSGMAWMNVTESSFTNIIDKLLKQIRERSVDAANGDKTAADRNAIIAELREYVDQIGLEMNQTYAGRYVFSGFRTDQPPVLNSKIDKTYTITQSFSAADIEKTKSYQKQGNTDVPVVNEINILKMAYNNLDGNPVITDKDGNPLAGYVVEGKSVTDSDAYTPVSGKVNYIAETGELVFHADDIKNFPNDGINVSYTKTGFEKGELNPMVYFTCAELTNVTSNSGFTVTEKNSAINFTNWNTLQLSNTNLAATLPTDTIGSFTYVAVTNEYDPDDPASIAQFQQDVNNWSKTINNNTILYDAKNGLLIMNNTTATNFRTSAMTSGIEISYDMAANSNPPPTAGTDITVTTNTVTTTQAKQYNMDNQEIQYECATNTYVTVNSLAKNVYTDKMYADLKALCDFVSSIKTSDPKQLEADIRAKYAASSTYISDEDVAKLVSDQLTDETAKVNAVLYDRFNNMLYLIDRHSDTAMKEQTQMGSRMNRLDLLAARLDQDETTYTELLSNNEDTNMVLAIIKRSAAEAAYQASLKVSANIVQMTLANFIG